MKIIFFLFLSLILPKSIEAQKKAKTQKKTENNKLIENRNLDSQLDSLITTKFNKTYIETLEKINSQINLASNPFSYFISALGVLFTILAIVASAFFYSQSKDFSDQRKKVINDLNENYLNEIVKIQNSFEEKLEVLDKKSNLLFSTFKMNFEAVLTPAQNSEFLKNISFFEKSLKDLYNFPPNSITVKVSKVEINNQFNGVITSKRECRSCNKIYYRQHLDSELGKFDIIKSVCPFCNNYEEEQKNYNFSAKKY